MAWAQRGLVAAGAAAAAATAGVLALQVDWATTVSLGTAVLIGVAFALPLYGCALWAALHRRTQTATTSELLEEVEWAHQRIDSLGKHYSTHEHPAQPERPAGTATNPYGMPAQTPATNPAPAIALTGGARLPVRGRHAAPDTGTTPAVTRHNTA